MTVSFSPMLLALYHQYSSLIYIYIYSYNVYIHSMAFGDCQFLAYALGTLSPIFITNIYIYIYIVITYIFTQWRLVTVSFSPMLLALYHQYSSLIYIYIYVITYIFTQWRLVTVSFSPMLLALYHQYSSLIYIYIYCYNVYIHSMAFGDCQFLAYALGTLSPIFITNIYIYIYML